MKPIDELTFIDDYMFGEVMKSKEICIGVGYEAGIATVIWI